MKHSMIIRQSLAGAIAMAAYVGTSYAQIPTNGLLLRLDGNVGVEQAIGVPAGNGDPVVRWLDLSGAGNNVTTNAPIITTTPTYRTGLVNGRSAVEFGFDTGTERLQAGSPLIAGTTDFSLFAVVRPAAVNPAGYIGGNYGLGNGGGLEFYVYQGKLNLYNLGLLQGTTPLATNTWYLMYAEKSGSTYTLRVNEAFNGSTTLGGTVGSGRNWTVGNGPDYNQNSSTGTSARNSSTIAR